MARTTLIAAKRTSASRWHRKYPKVEIELQTGNPQQLTRALQEGEVDVAFVAEPVADAPFEKVKLYEEELVLVSDLEHPSINSPADVGDESLLVFEPGCPHRARLEQWFADHGGAAGRIIEMGSYQAMLGCVIAGMGISLMPRAMIDGFPDRAQLGVHALPKGKCSADTVMIWRKGAGSPKVDALLELLRDPALGQDPVRQRRNVSDTG